MDIRINESKPSQFKAIFPNTLNANNTLFGGTALKWMDEVAYITATRYTRQKMVTISINKTCFLKAIQPNSIAEIVGVVKSVNNIKLCVAVRIFVEDMYTNKREIALTSEFVFAAVDDNHKACRIKVN